MYKVLAKTFGTEHTYRLVVVPIWTTAVAANDDLLTDNLINEKKE